MHIKERTFGISQAIFECWSRELEFGFQIKLLRRFRDAAGTLAEDRLKQASGWVFGASKLGCSWGHVKKDL